MRRCGLRVRLCCLDSCKLDGLPEMERKERSDLVPSYSSSHSLSCSSFGQPWYGDTSISPAPKPRRNFTGMYSTAASAGAVHLRQSLQHCTT